MRIIITESQYKGILKESKLDKLASVITTKYSDSSVHDIIRVLFITYGLNLSDITSNQKLNTFFDSKFGSIIRQAEEGNLTQKELSKKYGGDILEAIKMVFEEYVSNEIYQTYKLKNPITQIKRLKTIQSIAKNVNGYDSSIYEHITDTMEGLLDDAINFLFKSGNPIKIILKDLSNLKNNFKWNVNIKSEIDNHIVSIGKKNGYNLVPKAYNWTFQKGGGRIQSIINYIKDTPKTPKKTRGGWMQSIGEDPKRRGWNSELWSAILHAGIIQSQRVGKDTIYTLGPNAEAFEQGKLVGY